MGRRMLLVVVALLASAATAQKVDLGNQVKGQLPVANIVPGVNGYCLLTIGGSTQWAQCPSGTGYATVQSAGVAIAQRNTINFLGALSCVDDGANARSNCQLVTPITVAQGGTALSTLLTHALY